MEPEGSLPGSQEPSTGPYPEPDQSSSYHPILAKLCKNTSSKIKNIDLTGSDTCQTPSDFLDCAFYQLDHHYELNKLELLTITWWQLKIMLIQNHLGGIIIVALTVVSF
jgi:hypothetical protein